MLRNLKDLKGYSIEAIDGNIGNIKDFYFDDDKLVIDYLIIETGSWLLSRKILLPSSAINHFNINEKTLSVDITIEQLKDSLKIDTDKPVLHSHDPLKIAPTHSKVKTSQHCRVPHHLRSSASVIGCHIEAIDGHIGHVEGMLMDEETWTIRYYIINTSKWWSGHQLLIQPLWIKKMSRSEAKVAIGLKREEIKKSPPYNANKPFSHDLEERVHLYN